MKTTIKLFIVLFTSLFIFTGCDKNEDSNGEVTKIQIAALLPETGGLSYIGLSSKAALEIAIAEINQDFSAKNSPYRFELKVYDTQLDPTKAVQAMQSIATAGCKLVIGPLSSSELTAVKPIADSLGILVVSPSSTASSLSIPNDMIYRFVPGEKIVAQAMANSIDNQGKKALVLISRNDVGSLGLNAAYSSSFASLGIDTSLVATFDGNTTDFTTVLANIKNKITNYLTTHPLSEIGVVSTSFDETILLFNQAYGDSVLSSVNWYGGDGFYKNQNLLANPSASQFAVNTNFYSPGFSLPMANQNLWEPLLNKIYNLSGQEGDAFTLNSYDIVKVLAKMVQQNFGVPAFGLPIRNAFTTAANGYQGITGPILLNANGDRANGTFDYYGVQYSNNAYEWYFVGQSQRVRK